MSQRGTFPPWIRSLFVASLGWLPAVPVGNVHGDNEY